MTREVLNEGEPQQTVHNSTLKPKDQEVILTAGMKSSIKSKGVAGVANRLLARVFNQEDADIVGFISYISGKEDYF